MLGGGPPGGLRGQICAMFRGVDIVRRAGSGRIDPNRNAERWGVCDRVSRRAL